MSFHFIEMSEKTTLILKETISSTIGGFFHPDLLTSLSAIEKTLQEWKTTISQEKKNLQLRTIFLQGRKIIEIYLRSVLQINEETMTLDAATGRQQSLEAMINWLESLCKNYNSKEGVLLSPENDCIVPPWFSVRGNAESDLPRIEDNLKTNKYVAFVADPLTICQCFRTIKYYGNLSAHQKEPSPTSTSRGLGGSSCSISGGSIRSGSSASTSMSRSSDTDNHLKFIKPCFVLEMMQGFMSVFSKTSFQAMTRANIETILDKKRKIIMAEIEEKRKRKASQEKEKGKSKFSATPRHTERPTTNSTNSATLIATVSDPSRENSPSSNMPVFKSIKVPDAIYEKLWKRI